MIDQDRMLRFRSELHGIGDLDRVSGMQMLFAFQRFVAIVLDGETAEVAEPIGLEDSNPANAEFYSRRQATSSDDVPHDEPAPAGETTPYIGPAFEDPLPVDTNVAQESAAPPPEPESATPEAEVLDTQGTPAAEEAPPVPDPLPKAKP